MAKHAYGIRNTFVCTFFNLICLLSSAWFFSTLFLTIGGHKTGLTFYSGPEINNRLRIQCGWAINFLLDENHTSFATRSFLLFLHLAKYRNHWSDFFGEHQWPLNFTELFSIFHFWSEFDCFAIFCFSVWITTWLRIEGNKRANTLILIDSNYRSFFIQFSRSLNCLHFFSHTVFFGLSLSLSLSAQ